MSGMYCLDAATGKQIWQCRGEAGFWTAPTVAGGLGPNTCFGSLDLKSGRVRLVQHSHEPKDNSRPPGAPDFPWASFNYIGDETQALSCAPSLLLSNYQGYTGSLDRKSGQVQRLWGERDTYAGLYGPRLWGYDDQGGPQKAAAAGKPYAAINEWHGPVRSILSIAGGRVYYHSGNQIVCLAAEN